MNKTNRIKVIATFVLVAAIALVVAAIESKRKPKHQCKQATVYVLPTVDQIATNQNPFSF